jgi:hypothetical protein
MSDHGKRFSIVRVAALLAVLLIETALTVSLWASGWLGTGDHLRMVMAGAAAALPLIVAAALLFRHRFHFGLRALLAAMALVAMFMFFSVRPLLEAREARQASRWLADNGVKVFTELNRGDFFMSSATIRTCRDRTNRLAATFRLGSSRCPATCLTFRWMKRWSKFGWKATRRSSPSAE